MTTTQPETRWELANTNTRPVDTLGDTMNHDHFDPAAYDAAYHALTGKLDGSAAETAERITAAVCELWNRYTAADVKRYATDPNVRAPLVIGLLAAVNPAEWPRLGPLLDAAVAAAAQALRDGPNAVRHGYPLPNATA